MQGAWAMRTLCFILGATAMSACASEITPEQAADRCEERAQAAQAPEVGVTVGVNSNTGRYVDGSISLTSDYLRGRDPFDVYESCVINLTGQPPIRPPALRSL